MKPRPYISRISWKPRAGFALVVTLSLMILLTIVAVGLLSLASVSLRTEGQNQALAVARSNARMALMLAIGDLQKTTGRDRAITAPASIVDAKLPSGVTGVWEPWEPGTAPDSRSSTVRQQRFKQWLVSSRDGNLPSDRSNPPTVTAGSAGAVSLLDSGSLGDRKSLKGDDQRINVIPTMIRRNNANGKMAWAVIDESVKARANLFEKEPNTKQAAVMRVGAPPVEGLSALTGLEKLKPEEKDASRMITMSTAGLLSSVEKKRMQAYHPDLSVNSASLMTDVVSGGLKKDLSIWFSKGLSASERSMRLCRGNNVVSSTYTSDPQMALLESYHQYYKNLGKRSGAVTPSAEGLAAKLPSRYTPVRNGVAFPSLVTEPVMTPTVLRVDVIFSLVARDVHGGRASGLRNSGRPYMLHLLYLPVVTLHNPYNVQLSVEGLKVTFKNVPIAFQILVDNQPVTSSLVPLNQMYAGSEGTTSATKDFSCTLTSAVSGSGRPLVLEPGQTKLFGTPKVQPTWRWIDESPGAGADGVALFDWRNNQTADFNLAPKLMTDPKSGAGFDIDWLSPRSLQTEAGKACGAGEGIVALRGTELIGVNFGPFAPPAGNGNFDINIQLKQSGAFVDAGAYTITYGAGDVNQLKKILEKGTSIRFPSARSFPETFPKAPADKPFRVVDIFEKSDTPINAYIKPKPFVIFSVGCRTTKESFVPTRTIADGNPVMNVAKVDLSKSTTTASGTKDPLGGVPLELVMMPIRNGNAAIEDIRATEEGFAFGGSGTLYGTPRATFYEVPRGPLQSVAQFRHANLAGSGYMPLVTYTAGESRAHPQIGTSTVTSTWKSDNSTILDHTWLSNEALWDRYFFSTIADQTTPGFSTGKSYKTVMGDFFSLASRLPNQRFRPYNAGSLKTPDALESSNTPQDLIAGHLMLEGGFNVNSTSIDAWVAVLSALREAPIETYKGTENSAKGTTAFPRERRPTNKNIDQQVVNLRENRWEGYRSLTDSQIQALAKETVVEVRRRGPFLSVADFVNRGIGADSSDENLTGALQAALDRLNFNALADSDGIDLSAALLADHDYKSVKAATTAGSRNTASNAPGAITQGDILTGLGSRITVRADTFRVRAYGESLDNSGKTVIAKAWCEAIVQRVPSYVNPVDDPSVNQATPGKNDNLTVNQQFGRRYQVISFRWLSSEEV
jgi:hypothetical protein